MTGKTIHHTAFQGHLNDHKLMAARCSACESQYLPPRPLCPNCYSDQLEWVQAPEQGELAAFTIIHIAPTAMIDSGYGRDNPYCAGLVRLTDGQLISAQILGVDVNSPETIQLGTKLVLQFIQRGEGEPAATTIAFRAAGSGEE